METLALAVVVTAGLWLVAVALLMAARPAYCRHLFARMAAALEASSRRVQFIEQGLRVLVGVALIVRAPASKLPLAFEVAGWLLVGTSVLVLLAPIRWHGRFGSFWLDWLTPATIRILAPVPAVAGAALVYGANWA